jgi:hypothetical protein
LGCTLAAVGSAGMKRKGRRHLRKLRGHHDRGGGVTHVSTTYWGPMNINDGGHDAPGHPPTPRTRVVLWSLLGLLIAAAIVVIAVSVTA